MRARTLILVALAWSLFTVGVAADDDPAWQADNYLSWYYQQIGDPNTADSKVAEAIKGHNADLVLLRGLREGAGRCDRSVTMACAA